MIKHLLMASPLLLSTGAGAVCTPDAPEIGDIGPDSTLVCRELERRFPDALSAVEDRTIRAADVVAVKVSVDGRPMVLQYSLTGFDWTLTAAEDGLAASGR
jgi:hypothetical protein